MAQFVVSNPTANVGISIVQVNRTVGVRVEVTVGNAACTREGTVASISTVRTAVGVGESVAVGAGLTHPMANAKTRKAITLLNRGAIAGYYTNAVTIQHVREGNPN